MNVAGNHCNMEADRKIAEAARLLAGVPGADNAIQGLLSQNAPRVEAPAHKEPPKKFPPTAEQQHVYDVVQAPSERCVKIKAYAGATKTTTLAGIAERVPGNTVYVAFNRAIVEEAKERFPRSTQLKTAHQLAFYPMMIRGPFKGRQLGSLTLRDIRDVLGGDKISNDWAYLVRQTLMAFCNSDHEHISGAVISAKSRDALIERIDNSHHMSEAELEARVDEICSKLARHAGRLFDAVGKLQHLNVPHDYYLKVWALGRPRLNYDTILFDEAQDASPVMRGVIEQQKHAKRVYVGDGYQELYSWRGAENALDSVPGRELRLTTSFRFGSNIAEVANCLLRLVGERVPLRGGNPFPGVVADKYPTDMAFYTALNRTNAGIVECALGLEKSRTPFHVVGGVDELMEDLLSAFALYKGDKAAVRSNLVREYPTWEALLRVAEKTKDPVLKRTVKFVTDNGDETPLLVARVKAANRGRPEEARVILSTVHKYKGQECDNVVLMEDFKPMEDEFGRFTLIKEELFLLYVAATRAKKVLVTNKSLRMCIDQGKVHYV